MQIQAVRLSMVLVLAALPGCVLSPPPAAVEVEADVPAVAAEDAVAVADAGPAAPKPFPPATHLFDPDGAHVVALDLQPVAWQTILATAADPFKERVWQPAAVTIDGKVWAAVEARVFGESSMAAHPERPNVRIRFQGAGQGPEGIGSVRLKASGADPTFLREPLFSTLLQAAGAPARRWSWARLTVNGTPYGLYQVIEHAGGAMQKRLYGHDGPTFEAIQACHGLTCPKAGCAALTPAYEAEPPGDVTPVVALAQAIATASDAQLQTQIEALADLSGLLAVYVVEALASDLDGLAASGSNVELWQVADAAKPGPPRLRFVRGGADETFGEAFDLDQPWGAPNVLCPGRTDAFYPRVLAIPALKAKRDAQLRSLQCGAFLPATVKAWVAARQPFLEAELGAFEGTRRPKGELKEAFSDLMTYVHLRAQVLTKRFGPCP